ncbi:response regulator [Sphingomonas oryzagri]|uniref:Response regulator n=1 Tax=Sphingomonas oryzagri TaxID=3042314 RepID=A0ABT6N752_9SPHN|nr:response regulator [Sphingomonas oryzagri]MDH7640937.1 response regulator [Sphingomonas oryzagri]
MEPVRVFAIDDSAVVRSVISRIVETSGCCVLLGAAADVESARDRIAALRPDVVTLDLSLPGYDGIQYLDELDCAVHPAIVIVSAATSPGSPETLRALAHGADACFDKGRIVTEAALFIRTLVTTGRRRRATEIAPPRRALRA